MHAVMREYSGSGATKFFDLLESKKAEVKDVMMAIKGFVSYSLVRTARGALGSRATKRSAWHCGVEKMQPKQGSAARIWKLLLREI